MSQSYRRTLQHTLLLLAGLVLAGILIDLSSSQQIFWQAYLSMSFFYAAVYFVAVFSVDTRVNDHMLADRSLPLWLAVFTMSATWVGGGFINGSAEYAYSTGLVWVQAPWGYALSLIVGGLFFARPMRSRGYATLLDPILEKFGKRSTWFYYLPSLMGDVFWTAAILVALGTTFGTILDIDPSFAIVLSTMVVLIYTSAGGLWSVAMTDVIQLLLLLGGLCLVLFVLLMGDLDLASIWHAYREDMGASASFLPSRAALGAHWASWWDGALLLILGGIPWQVYFQRVLASKNATTAVRLSILAGFVCLLAAIPAILIGMIAAITEWTALGLPEPADPAYALPHSIRYLTSPWIATLGLGAVAAAVMSSADSSILASASVTSWNVMTKSREASRDQRRKTIRRLIWIIGLGTMIIALQVRSIYALWFLCSDLVYCLLFPALVTALFDPKANFKGAVAGFCVAFILRFGGGEALLEIPAILPYPQVNGVITMPFKTIAMLAGLATILLVSRLAPPKAT